MKQWNIILITVCILLFISFSVKAQIIQHRIDSLRQLFQESTNDSLKSDILNEQARYFLRLRNYKASDSVINMEAQISQRSHYTYGLFNAYLLKSRNYSSAYNFKDALPQLLKARNLLPILPSQYDRQKQAAKLNYNQGYYFMSGLHMDSALVYLNKARSEIEQYQTNSEGKQLLCNVFTFLSHSYAEKEKYDSAVTYIRKALQIADKLNDDLVKRDVYWGYDHLLANQGLYQQEIKYLQQMCGIEFKYGMYTDYAVHAFNIGFAYANMGDEKTANHYYVASIADVKKYADKDDYILGLQQYAKNLQHLHQLGKAGDVIKEALSLENLSKLTFTNFEVLLQLCDILHEERKYNEEWKFLKKADTLVAPSNLPTCTITLKQQEIKYYEAVGNYKAALNTMKHLRIIQDSVTKKSVQKDLAELNEKYEAAQKDKRITILNSNEKIAQAEISKQHVLNLSLIILFVLGVVTAFTVYKRIQLKQKAEQQIAQLEQANQLQQVRNKISRDMHDDLGASISKIGILSQHAKQQLEKNSTSAAIETFNKINKQTIEMINGLRSFIWAINPQYDELNDMLAFMRNYVVDFFENSYVKYHIDFPDINEEIQINPELKRNLFLVLKESLNNVIKHSKASEVSIRFVVHEKKYHLDIVDNGIGIDAYESKLFSNGLPGMMDRAREITGIFSINANQPTGTHLQLKGSLF